nr:uncharacterized protein LOC118683040 [Bactrocera oleae]
MHYGIFWLCAGLLLLACGQLTKASKGRGYYHDDANPGKCTLTDTVILSPGETAISLTFCGQLTCKNEEGLGETVGCGFHAPLKGCQWGDFKDETALYPDCCERYQICA